MAIEDLFGFGDKKVLERIADELHETNEELSINAHQLKRIGDILEKLFPPAKAVSATLTYTTSQGETSMASTPLALFVGQTATPTFSEFSASGASVPVVGPVTYAADSSGAVTVDPASGIVTGAANTAVGAVATVTATDTSNSLAAQATFTVTTEIPVATSATLTYTAGPIPAAIRARAKNAPNR